MRYGSFTEDALLNTEANQTSHEPLWNRQSVRPLDAFRAAICSSDPGSRPRTAAGRRPERNSS